MGEGRRRGGMGKRPNGYEGVGGQGEKSGERTREAAVEGGRVGEEAGNEGWGRNGEREDVGVLGVGRWRAGGEGRDAVRSSSVGGWGLRSKSWNALLQYSTREGKSHNTLCACLGDNWELLPRTHRICQRALYPKSQRKIR